MKLTEIFQLYNVPYKAEGHEHCRAGWIQTDCPYCSKDWGHYRLGFNIRFGYCNCWGCGRQRLIDTLVVLTDEHWSRIRTLVGDLEHEQFSKQKPTGKLVLPKGIQPLMVAHANYLWKRGLDPDLMVKLWELKAIGPNQELQWRIFIPIHYRGQVVSWTTRTIGDRPGLRYRAAGLEEEKLPHKELLFGEDYVRHGVIIHEGPFDVFKTGPGAVATFGTAFSRAQILKLSKYPLRVVCFDSNPEGQVAARKLCDLLESFPGTTMNIILDEKDAGCASNTELARLRALIA